MAQLALGVVGAVIGGYFGGPAGAQAGFAIGAAVGGVLDPQQVKGPRLEDLKTNQLEYGTPIPHLYGHARLPGVVVWSSDKQEVSQTSGGKGGPEVTSYTYKQDVLYVLSANECAGVRRIWSNGKLVWSAAEDATDSTIEASADTDAWEDIEFFTGAEDQLPWSVMEAVVGVGNTPAMRGRFTVGITGLNLGSSGFPPNLTFELVHTGDPGDANTVLQSYFDDNDASDISAYDNGQGTLTGGAASIANEVFVFDTVGTSDSGYQSWTTDSLRANGDPVSFEFFVDWTSTPNVSDINIAKFVPDSTTGASYRVAFHGNTGAIKFDTDAFGVDYTSFPTTYTGRTHGAVILGETETRFYLNGVKVYSAASVPPGIGSGQGAFILGSETAVADARYTVSSFRVVRGEIYTGDSFTPPSELLPPDGGTITANADPLDEVLEDLCVRSGLELSYVDASACSAQVVDSLAVSQVTPARQVIETLMAAKNVTVVEGDQLKFVLRGGAAITGPTYDELGATEGDPEGERLPITIRSDIEIPAQVAVTYANLLDDYQAGTEYSDRLIGGARGVTTVQLPLGLNPQEAKRIADIRLHDGALAATSIGPVGLTAEWSHLEPTDILTLTDQSGSTFRTRIEKITDGGGVRTLEVVRDDASIITSVALTDITDNSSTVVRGTEDTLLVPMDIPILRDADNDSDFYVAVSPYTSEGAWPGAALYRDTENLMTITDRTVIGTANTALGDFAGGFVFDEVNTLTVAANGALQSYTRDSIIDGTAAPYLVGSEIIYARTATLVSPGIYTLNGLLRGIRGTEWAIPSHEAGETIVRLQTNGLRRVETTVAQLGVEYTYKAVTAGRAVANAAEHDFANTGIGLKPFAPADLRCTRDGSGGFSITWSRRSRLSASLFGTVPLGEITQAYEVDILDGADVVRTISVTSEAALYTPAQQVADFGSVQSSIDVAVYQISEIVGRGYPLTGTLSTTYTPTGQVNTITLAGTFAAGVPISVYANGVLIASRTSVGGDTNLAGMATGLAAVIDATANYAASAAGNVVTVTGPLGSTYTLTSIVGGSSALSIVKTQDAAVANPGTSYRGELYVSNLATGITDPVPAGVTLRVTVKENGLTVSTFEYTTTASMSKDSALAGMIGAFADTTLGDSGYSMNMDSTTAGGSFAVFSGPVGTEGISLTTYGSAPWGLTVSVQSEGSPAVAENQPQIVQVTVSGTPANGEVFRVTLGGENFTYTATVPSDTREEVIDGLVADIDADADYSSVQLTASRFAATGAVIGDYSYSVGITRGITATVA